MVLEILQTEAQLTLAQSAAVVLTLLLLEAVLSFDNAAILAAIIRKLPKKDRKKALLYGLGGAYVLRITAIFLAAILIKIEWLKAAGGAYLLFLFIKHFVAVMRHRDGGHHEVNLRTGLLTRMGVPALVATVIQIELIDLVFAVDQVIVAVGFTSHIGLIITASVIGILFLRIAAAVMANVMDWLPLLEHMAYVAVGFVGIKLVLEYHLFGIHVSQLISIIVTLSLFLLPVLFKLITGKPASTTKHREMEQH